ncbi:hypothetical protein [uncultured Nonlabens sp.]|uniref:hypothetical protein n=1 Tax=uncultured Nonlabens sp. TaxID=859306 RepID=UPI0026115C6E|nr:hypothetical protein [uncultured Nonlabens sp.]
MKTLSLNESSSVMGGDRCSRLTARLARQTARGNAGSARWIKTFAKGAAACAGQ